MDGFLQRPALVFLLTVLIATAVIIVADFFAVGAFGLDYRVFRHAARLPIGDIYQPHPTAPFVYPPTAIAFFRPLGLFPVTIGYLFWAASSVALFIFATRSLEPRVVLLTIASAVFLKALLIGQSTIILGSLVLLACIRPGIASGILLGIVASVKPQIVLLAPLAFLIRRDWQILAGMAAGALAMLALELILFGVQPWFDWFSSLPAFRETLVNGDLLWIMVNPAGVAENWGLPSIPFLFLGMALGIAAVVRSSTKSEGIELAALITISSVISVPYAVAHDVLAALPFAAFIMFRDRFSVAVIAALLVLTLGFMTAGLLIFAILWVRPAVGSKLAT